MVLGKNSPPNINLAETSSEGKANSEIAGYLNFFSARVMRTDLKISVILETQVFFLQLCDHLEGARFANLHFHAKQVKT